MKLTKRKPPEKRTPKYTIPELSRMLGFRYADLLGAISKDPTAPRPVQLLKNGRATYYELDEVEAWLRGRSSAPTLPAPEGAQHG